MSVKEILLAYLGSTLNEPNDRLAEILFKKPMTVHLPTN